MKTTQPHTPGIVAPPPVIYLASLALAFGANAIAPQPISAPSFILHVVGAMFLLISSAFARWAFVAMKKQGTSANPRKQSDALTTDGPFKLSRNPIYVAMTGLYFGIALLGNSLWPFLFLVPLLATMYWGVVLREERYLTHRFGEAYLAYKSRTRRWL
jgi:protein-S-isoprenylcysteine O-methyltransferase Ste14